ncbi:MAG: twitch domain-containing radical SAM protein [Bdellovibrionales bacterium]|nr:twitch domain-containing radical SAM protein [Bdellovibrionales bacterium]
MENSAPKTFCPAPWTTLASSNDGSVQVCCRALHPLKPPTGQTLKFAGQTFAQIWNGPEYRNFRRQMLDGQPTDTCTRCYQEESAGILSRRQRSIKNQRQTRGEQGWAQWLSHLQAETGDTGERPSHVEVRLGSNCNLRCRICAPEFSQPIRRTMEAVIAAGQELPAYYRDNLARVDGRDDLHWQNDYIASLLEIAPSIRSMYFAAGEPLVTPAYQKLVDGLIRSGDARHIQLTVNTNGTTAAREWLERFKAFERTELWISLDGIGKAFEYQRSGAAWDRFERNFEAFTSLGNQLHLRFFPTISLLNVMHLTPLLRWIGKRTSGLGGENLSCQINLLHTPIFLHAQWLPASLVGGLRTSLKEIERDYLYFRTPDGQNVMTKLNALLDLCGQVAPPQVTRDLLYHTQLLDRLYHQELGEYMPETAQVLAALSKPKVDAATPHIAKPS